jgi:hypothetical protein
MQITEQYNIMNINMKRIINTNGLRFASQKLIKVKEGSVGHKDR